MNFNQLIKFSFQKVWGLMINFDHKNLKEGPLGFIVNNKLIKRTLLNEVLNQNIFHLNTVQKYLTLIMKTLTIVL